MGSSDQVARFDPISLAISWSDGDQIQYYRMYWDPFEVMSYKNQKPLNFIGLTWITATGYEKNRNWRNSSNDWILIPNSLQSKNNSLKNSKPSHLS